jgi:outer membrane protein
MIKMCYKYYIPFAWKICDKVFFSEIGWVMTYRRYIVKFSSFTALALSMAFSSNAQAMNLREALAIAYKNNPELKSERSKLDASDENVTQANSGYMPSLTANGNLSYENADNTFISGQNRTTANTPKSANLQFQQNLYAGGRTMEQVERADNQVMSQRAALHNKEQQIFSQTVTAYSDLVRTKEILALSQHNESVLAQEVEATKIRFNLGDATKTDVSQAESRHARAISDRIAAEGELIQARSNFKKFTLVEAPDNVKMPTALPSIPKNVEEVSNKALKQNPQVISAEYGTKISENDINLALGALLPTVNLTGSIARTENDYDNPISTLSTAESTDQQIRLAVSIPLYQGGDEYSKIRQAKDTKESALSNLEAAKAAVETASQIAWKDLHTSRANIDASNKAVKASKLALESIREEQAAGTRTTLDVLDQEQELFTSQVNLANARRNEVIALFNVLSTMGELTAKNLNLDVKLHDPVAHYEDVKMKPFGLGN